MSFHILLLDRAGNNLVNADFSPYSRMFFAVRHIYLTLYIVHICCVAPIYSVPACACCPCGRVRVCGRVCAWACVCAALASVVRAYIVASPAVLPRAGLAVNFFEIVFKPSISVRLSSAGVVDTT